jgi:hypothetical protein
MLWLIDGYNVIRRDPDDRFPFYFRIRVNTPRSAAIRRRR